MKREVNPFLAVAIAAAQNKGVTLSAKQCKKLMKNDYVYSTAVNSIPSRMWDKIMEGEDEIRHLKEFAKFA